MIIFHKITVFARFTLYFDDININLQNPRINFQNSPLHINTFKGKTKTEKHSQVLFRGVPSFFLYYDTHDHCEIQSFEADEGISEYPTPKLH